MRRFLALGILLLLIVTVIAGCAPGPNDVERTPDKDGKVAGFWLGIWHGLISPITFIISVFDRDIRFYQVHNNGNWYNFGFVIGAGLFFSGGIFGRRRRR